ncbi:uncharacterized protein N7477_000921 [Penicillium maclennaniae]|uniref:uncharacterized protein n=1 Tax=Penicillium maclennaniae TaxID=1343394 RepID=UPI00254012E8|nr:uncharacterized protein N7477_000921 [Penicillium maclennaniae]KAJ5684576.1 hypothetical protein N7477_000921 [Penicillium maclennaniae]
MGVIRFPRPAGIYVPSSPVRLTNDMISPPLSADFNFDAETVTLSTLPALEYISQKLQQRMMHVTLLVGRGKPYPTGEPSDLMIIPITSLDAPAWRILERAISKAAKKFSLGQSWSDALNRSQYERHANEYLVQQSILQNEVVFSQEGLTLLNMDRIYTFKRRLCILSNRPFSRSDDQSMASCVKLLHRLIADFQGRPFSKAFFHRVYEQLDVRDDLLTAIAVAYKSTHKLDAIILPQQPKAEQVQLVVEKPMMQKPIVQEISVQKSITQKAVAQKPATKAVRAKRPAQPARCSIQRIGAPAKRGPKTPLSASDVTPITRNEWNFLVSQDIRLQPTVTKWTPSPTVYAVA